MHIVILQRRPEDKDGILEAVNKICPEYLMDIHIFTHLSDAKDAIKTEGGLFKKKKKKDVVVITSAILGDVSGDIITKKILKWNEHTKIYSFTTSPESFKKTKRLSGTFKKRKYDKEHYEAVVQAIKKWEEEKK